MLWELVWFSSVQRQLLCSCLQVCIWEAWKEVVTTELNWNRMERVNSIGNRSSQETLCQCKTIKSTDVLGSTAELKRSWRCLEEDNQLTRWPPPCWFIHQVGLSSPVKTWWITSGLGQRREGICLESCILNTGEERIRIQMGRIDRRVTGRRSWQLS